MGEVETVPDESCDEDAEDLRDALLALEDVKRNGTKSLAEVKKELGLDDDD